MRYIWINCLCIVQSDKENWKLEPQEMGSFCELPYLTIAATE
jgi:hypothetical protein